MKKKHFMILLAIGVGLPMLCILISAIIGLSFHFIKILLFLICGIILYVLASGLLSAIFMIIENKTTFRYLKRKLGYDFRLIKSKKDYLKDDKDYGYYLMAKIGPNKEIIVQLHNIHGQVVYRQTTKDYISFVYDYEII